MKKRIYVKKYRRRTGKVQGHSKVITTTALLGNVSDKSKLPKKDVKSAYEALVDVMQKEFKQGKDVSLAGLGRFKVKKKPARKARPGRNPSTGEKIMIKAKPSQNVLTFRPAKEMKLR